ncbi:DUF3291 domain-containing protein [Maribacter sp. 2307ULW6-5]|uniref:DUF3291 domain-containing protein n=1 Tax=Maribacter sp. 2307ULW6-5 TaxID=3386275 RepID=UPI0039BCA119
MMQFAHGHLRDVPGLQTYKLMGSGKEGFDPMPDWSVYALLQIWDNEVCADVFFNTATLMDNYGRKASERWTIYMRNTKAVGKWGGKNPFETSNEIDPDNPLMAVITRATIKLGFLRKFWRYVPTSQAPLAHSRGLLHTKGIGEVPFVQMATFSIWENGDALMDFAYKSKEHRQAIVKTRKLDWYKEELFSRFQPYRSVGSWQGKDPLEKYLG